jgi:uncharacterized protein
MVNLGDQTHLIVNTEEVREGGLILRGELPALIFDISEDDRIKYPNSISYEVRLNIVNHALLVEGTAETILRCRCDRCLGSYDHLVHNANICHYLEIPDDRLVDLTEEIREDILINFPQKCLCKSNCAGVCRSCGQNQNLAKCDCQEQRPVDDVWSKLDDVSL